MREASPAPHLTAFNRVHGRTTHLSELSASEIVSIDKLESRGASTSAFVGYAGQPSMSGAAGRPRPRRTEHVSCSDITFTDTLRPTSTLRSTNGPSPGYSLAGRLESRALLAWHPGASR
jgi:hypothetical protein